MSAPEAALVVEVALSDIVRDARYQVRTKMQAAAVRAYANAMKAGVVFPPITVTRLGGALVLLDGFHRAQAAALAGVAHLRAVVVTCTPKEAPWLAAEANLRHGIPLNRAALRAAFRAFMHARKYRQGKDGLLSLRDIAERLGGTIHHETVRRWMQRDFSSIARRYAGEAPPKRREPDLPSAVDVLAETAGAAIANAVAAARGIQCPALRTILAGRLEDALKAITEGHPAEVREVATEVEAEPAF